MSDNQYSKEQIPNKKEKKSITPKNNQEEIKLNNDNFRKESQEIQIDVSKLPPGVTEEQVKNSLKGISLKPIKGQIRQELIPITRVETEYKEQVYYEQVPRQYTVSYSPANKGEIENHKEIIQNDQKELQKELKKQKSKEIKIQNSLTPKEQKQQIITSTTPKKQSQQVVYQSINQNNNNNGQVIYITSPKQQQQQVITSKKKKTTHKKQSQQVVYQQINQNNNHGQVIYNQIPFQNSQYQQQSISQQQQQTYSPISIIKQNIQPQQKQIIKQQQQQYSFTPSYPLNYNNNQQGFSQAASYINNSNRILQQQQYQQIRGNNANTGYWTPQAYNQSIGYRKF